MIDVLGNPVPDDWVGISPKQGKGKSIGEPIDRVYSTLMLVGDRKGDVKKYMTTDIKVINKSGCIWSVDLVTKPERHMC